MSNDIFHGHSYPKQDEDGILTFTSSILMDRSRIPQKINRKRIPQRINRKSNFERDSISFLITRNRYFDENYPPTAFLFGYPNITVFYSEFSLAKNRKRE
jgi:hypothetical protein